MPAPPHPEERACRTMPRSSDGRARVSKDGAAETLMLRDAARGAALKHEGGESAGRGEYGETRSRSRERDVVPSQSCGFFLFSSCSGLLSAARRADQRSAGGAHFRFLSGGLEETRNAGLWPAACFSPVIYRKRRLGGGRLRTLPPAARITTSRVSAGARLRD